MCIAIQDNTIRDGMQQNGIVKDIVSQKKILNLIAETNINSIEIGMCTTNFEFRLAEEKIKSLNSIQKAAILTRMNIDDIDLFISLNEKHKNAELKLLIPISDLHIIEKLGFDRVSYIQKINDTLEYINSKNLVIEICLEDATRADESYLFDVLDVCNKFPITYITIADTVGFCTPDEYGQLFKSIINKNYNFKLSTHCHNDLGLATANTFSAVLNGAHRIETTFLGIGERAGNTAIDEIICLLKKKAPVKFNVTPECIYKISMMIKKIINFDISPIKPVLGKNAFVHESGIHQDGTLKNKNMYQYLLPEDIGMNNDDLIFPISSLSSKKIIKKQFNSISQKNNCDDLINFYKNISMIINNISIEQCLELFNVVENKQGANYVSA